MTKEEAILWLNEEIRTWENECQSKHPIKEALYEACKALEQEPSWIPVTERLPEYSKEVLTCSNYGFIEIQSLEKICNDYWENQKGDRTDFDKVVAWMPLPQLYKAEGEGKE